MSADQQSQLVLLGKDINYRITDRRRIILRINIDKIVVNLTKPTDEIRIWGLPNHTSDYVSIANYYETGDGYLELQGFKMLLWIRGVHSDVYTVSGTYKQLFIHTVI